MVQKRTRTQARDGGADDARGGSVGRHGLKLIKPPAAPAVIHCEEVGRQVAQDRAIREKLRLYPRASVKEIVAMFELEGLNVSPAAVKKITAGKKDSGGSAAQAQEGSRY